MSKLTWLKPFTSSIMFGSAALIPKSSVGLNPSTSVNVHSYGRQIPTAIGIGNLSKIPTK